MIVVDSSALVAILENEPAAERFIKALHDASRCLASAVPIYETGKKARTRAPFPLYGWIPLACLVWLVAGVMAVNRNTRREGLSLALAMAATFPSVFLFQAAAAPLIVAMVFGAGWLSGVLDPTSKVTHVTTNGPVVAIISGTVLLGLVIMLTVSVIGFLEGWLLGWRCINGEHVPDAIKRGPTVRLLGRLGLRKLHAS